MIESNEYNEKECEIENVHVVVRIRPFNKHEEAHKYQNVTCVIEEENIITLKKPAAPAAQIKSFKFDHIFPENCSQINVYKKIAAPIIRQIFKGFNGTIFAYGQTGSGKTYTMSGDQDSTDFRGIIPNTFSHIFSQISQASGEKLFAVTATYLEIYNEEVRDLLSCRPNQKLQLRERTDIGVYIKGLTGFTVDSIKSINELMKLGNLNRKTRATAMNKLSSRSHAIFTITIEAKNQEDQTTTVAKLNLVDLAGSERLSRSQATGDGLREAASINQSLFVLSNVISALVEGKTNHIPYRNSKLTRLLQNSLGGNSTTAMIAAISPCELDYDETLCTLRYASRAKLIKNYVRLNLQTNKGLLEHLEQQLLEMQKRLASFVLNEERVVAQRLKKHRPKSEDAAKHKEQDVEISNINMAKKDLQEKIAVVQNKILIGGHNLYDKVQEQQFLLETSFEQLKSLDKSHQELEELLGEKEIESLNLKERHCSFQEEDKSLNAEIAQVEMELSQASAERDEDNQQYQQELDFLRSSYLSSVSQLKRVKATIQLTIPQEQLQKIKSKISWNEDTYDYQLNGIAHAGNNVNKAAKLRFQKHIPTSDLMGNLLNIRKTALRPNSNLLKHPLSHRYYRYLPHNGGMENENVSC